MNVQDGCSSKNVQTDDTITELTEQYTNLQVFKNKGVFQGTRQNEESERHRHLITLNHT